MPRPRSRLLRLTTGLVAGTAAALAASTLSAAPASADEVRPAVGGSFTFVGHGYGHGIGMSQWGAQSRAVAGQGYRTILDFYYPGTAVASRENRTLRVGLTALSTPAVTVAAPTGAALSLSTSGRKVEPGQRLVVTGAGGGLAAGVGGAWQEAWGGAVTVSGPDGVLLVKADGTSVRYEGTVRIVPGSPNLTVVNDVPLETYLRGVVPAESPSSWNAEALKAQAVAARSYALSVLRAQAQTDICDTTACQVYRGAESRDAAGRTTWTTPASTNAAIAATAGEVRAHGGEVAFTQFSSSNGGWSVAGSKPYLVAKEDPFSAPGRAVAGDPVAAWTATVAASTLDGGCAPGGAATGIVVTGRDGRGDFGGRVRTARLLCTNGTVEVTGTKLRQLGGLRSDFVGIVSAVQLAHQRLGGTGGPLGAATSAELGTPNGRGSYQHFQGGSIYASAAGAHDVRGAIRQRWAQLGWENGLGFPTGGDSRTPDGSGFYTHFEHGSIYYSAATGAREVRGAIRERWAQLGWERGMGFPTTGDVRTPNGAGYYTHFQGGSIYWSPATGAREVRGAIRERWAQLGWENGALGFPATGDVRTPNGRGSYTRFQGGSIYWSPATGAHAVRGGLLDTWGAQGWENGSLGFPASDETWVGGVLVQRFEGGTLTWNPATGTITRS
ncbi:SpoIID/LytB domain-containing protein [Kineococcus sp. T13]|uniref:SpoIID/LytB domain-containing protein n=1 Tax=Kineococcus vitellinus TaxID=2696565 RepID=UPI001412354B|nr:SpoIID/LytB domain-containing protein [Kineococcus vitellinus]NAZ77102.1 SpoIID/LytB domain-containing protein [Kineococcus vitellinus]